jgi:hypothetical protein
MAFAIARLVKEGFVKALAIEFLNAIPWAEL